jgi:hypothetical protein
MGRALLLLSALVGLAALPSSAAAATAVPAVKYTVRFDGTASEDVHATFDATDFYEQTGSWTVADADPTYTLWLPKSASTSLPETLDGFDETGPTSGQDPGTVTETGQQAGGQPYSCSQSQVLDSGFGVTVGRFVLGNLVVVTDYDGFPDAGFPSNGRFFSTNAGNPSAWTCSPSDDGPQGTYKLPPAADRNQGGTVTYSASLPWSDVGQQSFTIPIDDTSNVGSAPAWSSYSVTSASFGITGNYTFTKVCDGTATFTGVAQGTCGGTSSSGAPNTSITKLKTNKTKRSVKITFKGTAPGGAALHFKCKLDKGRFASCSSPKTYKHLKKGKHTFAVEAIDSQGKVDPTPAKTKFRV